MIKTFAAAVMAIGALLAGAATAHAATISIVSMHYSKAHPVPHFSYEGGTVAGDVQLLQSMVESFVHCREECASELGRSNAVLTLKGPGGDYHEGLRLADFLRANNIATVVESGTECYSACAFAFLGGTGYSTSDRIGQYVDRVVEPGGIVGFHAPYRNEASLRQALLERTPADLLVESRDSLSLMTKELVKWNVDPEIIHSMLNKGPSEFAFVGEAENFYLTRTALPPLPSSAWISDIPTAIRNACIRLLALYERTNPIELSGRIITPFEQGIGLDESGKPVSGYRLSDRLLDVGFCAATDASIATGNNLAVALYLNPGVAGGKSLAVLSFFNRDDYFSTASIGASPLKRIFQRGGMGHWFLPLGIDVAASAPSAGILVLASKFFSIGMPDLPPLPAGFAIDVTGPRSRVSHNGSFWLFEQVGSDALFDTALTASDDGVTLTHDSVLPNAFVRDGTHADGTYFSLTGFKTNGTSFVQRILILNGGQPLTEADRAMLGFLNCGASFRGVRLTC